MTFSKYISCRTKRKPARLPGSSISPPTSVGMRYGSSSMTGIPTRLAAASASKPLRAVPNVNWAPTMDIARRRPALSSLKVPDIVGPLPPDHRHEFLIVFVDCYSKSNILIPSSNHTANTVSEALMRHVIPYFGTPLSTPLRPRPRIYQRHLDQAVALPWGIQQVLTSPYHPEGNAINERSHRTLNNMLCARLLEGPSSRHGLTRSQESC